jgi:hypothetical protein
MLVHSVEVGQSILLTEGAVPCLLDVEEPVLGIGQNLCPGPDVDPEFRGDDQVCNLHLIQNAHLGNLTMAQHPARRWPLAPALDRDNHA